MWQDLGFLSFTLPEVEILMPTKKPRGAELTLEQDLANQALHQRRLRIEHVNSSQVYPDLSLPGFRRQETPRSPTLLPYFTIR